MDLKSVFKLSDVAVGAIKGKFVRLYADQQPLPVAPDSLITTVDPGMLNNRSIRTAKKSDDDMQCVWAIQADWITENSEQYGYAPVTTEELAVIADEFRGRELFDISQYNEEYGFVRLHSRAIFETDRSMCQGMLNNRFVPVYLLSDAIAAIEKGMQIELEKMLSIDADRKDSYVPKQTTQAYDLTKSKYDTILEHLRAQYNAGKPFYVNPNAVSWYPDYSNEQGFNPYEQAVIDAQAEVDRLQSVLLAAGAASLL